MPFQFVNNPVPLQRVKQISPRTFIQQYRNKHPIILSHVISDWLPLTKWTTRYLQEALEHNCSHDDLQVFVSHDNRLFINHPEVTETITITPEDFLKRVFDCKDVSDIPTTTPKSDMSNKQRYYLRTHSMPDMLFKDINIPDQMKLLLDVLCCDEEGNVGHSNTFETQEDTEEQSALCSNEEVLSRGEEMLTFPDDPGDVSVELEGRNISHRSSSAITAPIKASCISSSVNVSDCFVQLQTLNTHQHSENIDVMNKSCNHHDNISMSVTWQKMQTCIFNQSTMQLWIGTQGNVTPLHYDRNHGLLAQIVGRKELTLFSHEDTPNLYPHMSYSERAHTSRIDLQNLDAEGDSRFPKLRNAQPYTCTLEPGELLYMPPFWWHDVTSLDDCISVTLPWDMESNETIPACMLT